MFVLDLYKSGKIDKTIEFVPGNRTSITFGRSPQCDYVLDENPQSLVSRVQATLELRGIEWWLVDGALGGPKSENGLWVGHEPVKSDLLLGQGDRVWLYRQNGNRAELRVTSASKLSLDETHSDDIISRIGRQLDELRLLVATGADNVAKVNQALTEIIAGQQEMKAIDLEQNKRLDEYAAYAKGHKRRWGIALGACGIVLLITNYERLSSSNQNKIQDALVNKGIEALGQLTLLAGAGYAVVQLKKTPEP